jgi:hypothetical protein
VTDERTSDRGGPRPQWKSVLLSTLGTVLGLVLFFAMLALMLANLHESDPPLAEGELSAAQRIRQLHVEDRRKLTTYELIDEENNVWRIPIDVAIEKMIAEAQTKRRDN